MKICGNSLRNQMLTEPVARRTTEAMEQATMKRKRKRSAVVKTGTAVLASRLAITKKTLPTR